MEKPQVFEEVLISSWGNAVRTRQSAASCLAPRRAADTGVANGSVPKTFAAACELQSESGPGPD